MTINEIATFIGRHRATVYRELARNKCRDDGYRCSKAQLKTNGRRRRSRRNLRFGKTELALVKHYIRRKWSPEQISGTLAMERKLSISHETIYQLIWRDKKAGGKLYRHLRGSPKQRRKRYGSYDSRGRLAGKRHITERPISAENRSRFGHWEVDTVMGSGDKHCIFTMVERKTGYLLIGKLENHTKDALTKRAIALIRAQCRTVRTITADNGTEFHGYAKIEESTGALFYFANPYHSWERGTNENTNGLIRQYLPKRKSMAHITQADCTRIAEKLNTRPRKRLGFRTPKERYELH
jgi:IS30 family transposase